jgi:hypothetical protein
LKRQAQVKSYVDKFKLKEYQKVDNRNLEKQAEIYKIFKTDLESCSKGTWSTKKKHNFYEIMTMKNKISKLVGQEETILTKWGLLREQEYLEEYRAILDKRALRLIRAEKQGDPILL